MNLVPVSFHGIRTITIDGRTLYSVLDFANKLGAPHLHSVIRRSTTLKMEVEKHAVPDTVGRRQESLFITTRGILRYLVKANNVDESIVDQLIDSITNAQGIIAALENFDVPEECEGMFVYAIREKETGNIKLGISRDPQQRVKQLQTGNSSELELVAVRPAVNGYASEKELHSDAGAYRIRGEWFSEEALALVA